MQSIIVKSDIKTIDSKLTRLIYQALFFCLDWIRDEELSEDTDMTILVKHRKPATIIYTPKSATYLPSQVIPTKLNLSDWRKLEKGGRVSIEAWQKLLKKYLPECKVKIKTINGKEVLEFAWPKNFQVFISKDDSFKEVRQGIDVSYSILTVLTEQPDWLASHFCKGSFKDRVVMGFAKKGLIVYEGKGATYIFNEKGVDYAEIESIDIAKNSKDLIQTIPHRNGYDNWKEELLKVLRR